MLIVGGCEFLMSEAPLQAKCRLLVGEAFSHGCTSSEVQVFFVNKKMPAPLGFPWDLRHRVTVGS